jgi:chorismate synthase
MFKVINENGKRHDYSNTKYKPHITHMVLDMSNIYDVQFKELKTHGFLGTIRTASIVDAGDFIYKSMESGEIGVYEVVERMWSTVVVELGEPFRDYKCRFVLCGYLKDDGFGITIFSGYGVQ